MARDINKILQRGLTVGQLKEILDNYDENTPVVIGYNYGDYWNSQVADNISEPEGETIIEWSDYHNKFKESTDFETIDAIYDDHGMDDNLSEEEKQSLMAHVNAKYKSVLILKS